MTRKEDLISKIIELEWDMFSAVQNRGGRASCQENPETFKIIRISNFMSWSEETLESYLNDLEEAKKAGRNTMTEKYALMEGIIPHTNTEALPLIDKIVEIELKWLEELAAKNPHLQLARPIYSSQDKPYAVSSETYSRGELETYSKKTLESYYRDLLEVKSKNLNRVEIICNNMIEAFNQNQ